MNRLAQAEPDIQADPRHLGRLITNESWYLNDLGDGPACRDAAERAVRSFPVDPPSVDRVNALGDPWRGRIATEGRVGEAIAIMNDAQAIANRLGDDASIAGNLGFLPWMLR